MVSLIKGSGAEQSAQNEMAPFVGHCHEVSHLHKV